MDEYGRLGYQLPDETKKRLCRIEKSVSSKTKTREKTSKAKRKEKHYFRLLEAHPDLKDRLISLMGRLDDQDLVLPLLHFTTGKILLPDGSEQNPGFIADIQQNGLREGSHVSCFVSYKKEVGRAAPADYVVKPEELVRNLAEKVVRYVHHGYRTNKRQLSENHSKGLGQPVILLVEATKTKLVSGSDYPDHRILKKALPHEDIFQGLITVPARVPFQDRDLISLVDSFVGLVEARLSFAAKGGENHG